MAAGNRCTRLSALPGAPPPGFVIHNNHVFDGIAEHQVTKALQFGAEDPEAAGFQYIATMNPEALPRTFRDQLL